MCADASVDCFDIPYDTIFGLDCSTNRITSPYTKMGIVLLKNALTRECFAQPSIDWQHTAGCFSGNI